MPAPATTVAPTSTTAAPASTTTTTLPLAVLQQNFRAAVGPLISELQADGPPPSQGFPPATWSRITAAAATADKALLADKWPAAVQDPVTALQDACHGIVSSATDGGSETYQVENLLESSTGVGAALHL